MWWAEASHKQVWAHARDQHPSKPLGGPRDLDTCILYVYRLDLRPEENQVGKGSGKARRRTCLTLCSQVSAPVRNFAACMGGVSAVKPGAPPARGCWVSEKMFAPWSAHRGNLASFPVKLVSCTAPNCSRDMQAGTTAAAVPLRTCLGGRVKSPVVQAFSTAWRRVQQTKKAAQACPGNFQEL